tara:strand:+ start:1270 stop:2391 length:1122 start_codon:yes stop_codon:yes gene_type:complete
MKILFVQKKMSEMGGSEKQMDQIFSEISKYSDSYFWSDSISENLFPDLITSSNFLLSHGKQTKSRTLSWIINLSQNLKKLKPDIVYTRDSSRIWFYFILSKIFDFNLVWGVNHKITNLPINLSDCLGRLHKYSKSRNSFAYWVITSYFLNLLLSRIKLISNTTRDADFCKKRGLDFRFILTGHKRPSINISKDQPPTIISLGGIQRRHSKRPHILPLLAEKMQDLDVNFFLAGSRDAGTLYQAFFDKKSKELKNFTFLGPLDNSQALKLISRSMIYVNGDSASSMSNAIIEAWMLKTLVVVTSEEANPESYLKEKNLVKYCKLPFLEKEIRHLLENSQKTEEVVKKAYKFSTDRLVIEKTTKEIYNYFVQVNK